MALVNGGLAANGWDWLASTISADRRGPNPRPGNARRKQSRHVAPQNPYLLTPVMPEPHRAVFLGDCLFAAKELTAKNKRGRTDPLGWCVFLTGGSRGRVSITRFRSLSLLCEPGWGNLGYRLSSAW